MVAGIGHAAPRPVIGICSSYLYMSLGSGLSDRAERPGPWLFLMYRLGVANWCRRLDVAHKPVLFGLYNVLLNFGLIFKIQILNLEII